MTKEAITDRQKRWLKTRVHHLKPVVTVGQAGLTDAVLNEIDAALTAHELIKVRINAGDRGMRDAMIGEIAARSSGDLVSRIGNVAAFFRANPKKRHAIQLPAQ
jgi:RNA-binding protein